MDAWGLWGVAYRDLVVLDQNNEVVTVYNLTSFNLTESANYETLKTTLVDTAQNPPAR